MSELPVDEVHSKMPYEMPCRMTYQDKADCTLTSPLLHGGLFTACLPILKQHNAHARIVVKTLYMPVG